MLLAVTQSEWGHPHSHGFSLGSTLCITLCCSVISLPRTSKPLHARHCKPGLQVPRRAKYGHCHTWVGTGLQRAGRALSDLQMSTQRVLGASVALAPPPLPPGRGPPLLTSTSMCSPLHWDSNNTHASLTSRCGAVGVPRVKVPPRRAEKEIKPGWRGMTRKSKMLILVWLCQQPMPLPSGLAGPASPSSVHPSMSFT